jgi:hypothetical protein
MDKGAWVGIWIGVTALFGIGVAVTFLVAFPKLSVGWHRVIFGGCLLGAILSLVAAVVVATGGDKKTSPPPLAPPPSGMMTVDDASKCPKGYSIIEASQFERNGTAISAPADAKICLVKDAFRDNHTGIELRPIPH